MKNRNIVLLALAIGCGLVAAFLTAKLGASNKTDMVGVLVAAKNLDQGLKMDEPEKLFVRKPFPRESVPPEFIDDVSQLKGKILQRTVRPGAHITMEDITPKATLALPVRADGTMYKAMAIKVAPETVVGGLVLPGAHVDVISVERFTGGKVISQTVLQNVLVVAVNTMTTTPDQVNSVKDAATVTLAVTLKEGKILYLAGKRGEISLMLRSKDDTEKVKNDKNVESVDGKRDDDSNGAAEGGPQTVKVPVPKKDIAPGTKITDPIEYFEEKELPESALPANAIRDMDALKGQTFTKHAYEGMPVAKAAIEGELPKPAAPAAPAVDVVVKPAVKTHTIIFQVGTAAPTYVHYDDKGRLMEDAKAGAPAAAPVVAGDSPAIKPESPAKDGKGKGKDSKDAEDKDKKSSNDE